MPQTKKKNLLMELKKLAIRKTGKMITQLNQPQCSECTSRIVLTVKQYRKRTTLNSIFLFLLNSMTNDFNNIKLQLKTDWV